MSNQKSAGLVLPNPRVRTLGGRVVRLDDLLAESWTLLAAGFDPTTALDSAARTWADRRCATVLAVVKPGGLRAVTDVTCPVVEDLDGTLTRLLRSRGRGRRGQGRGRGRVAVVRPDRYLLGLFPTPLLGERLGGSGVRESRDSESRVSTSRGYGLSLR